MNIVVIGLSHKTAVIEIREQVALREEQIPQALEYFRTLSKDQGIVVKEVVILSTCNRVEIYAVVDDVIKDIERIKIALSDFHQLPPHNLSPHFYHYANNDAVKHLFSVVSGMDSMLRGETQIQGQVKKAFQIGQKFCSNGPILSALFRKALTVGKRVRYETKFSQEAFSISDIAIQILQKNFPNLRDINITLIGISDINMITLKKLSKRGVQNICLINRRPERADAIGRQFQLNIAGLDQLSTHLKMTDVLISCTASPDSIVSLELAKKTLMFRPKKHILIIDMAVPRDIDPAIQHLSNVTLYNLDQLQNTLKKNQAQQSNIIIQVENIIQDELKAFLSWHQSVEIKPLIKRLRQHADNIRQRELKRTLRRLQQKYPDQDLDLQLLDELSHRIINKLLHEPFKHLHKASINAKGSLYPAVVQSLFQLDQSSKS